MVRVVLGVVFFITSTALIVASTLPSLESTLREILGNLGTEIFGILVTIALVDWYLEKRRRQDRAKELAWSVLHEIEHAAWVWQGGPRHMGTNELLGIISGIHPADSLTPFTEGLMMNIGLQARSVLQKEPSAVKSLPGIAEVLHDLVSLATIRDLPASTRIRTIAEILEESVNRLSHLLGQSTDRMPSGLIWHRDSSPSGQEARYRRAWPHVQAPGVGPEAQEGRQRSSPGGPRPTEPSPGGG